MAVRRIIRMGHPLLRQVARPLTGEEVGSGALAALVDDMVDTLRDYGGVGLAAPQIGESVRLALVELEEGGARYGEAGEIPLTVFINPVVTVLDSNARGYWEGCLSVPGLRGFVERPQHVKVQYTTLAGDSETLELTGFPATVVQHEFDHLDGRLYVDRIKDTELLSFEREFQRYVLSGGKL